MEQEAFTTIYRKVTSIISMIYVLILYVNWEALIEMTETDLHTVRDDSN